MKAQFKWILKAIIVDKKDHVLEAKHVPNTNAYQLYIDNQLRFNEATFPLQEVKEKIEFLKQFYSITEEVIPEFNEEGEVIQKRYRRTKLEMQTYRRQKESEHANQTKQPRKNPIRIPNSISHSVENIVAIKKRGRPPKKAGQEKIVMATKTTKKRSKQYNRTHKLRKTMESNVGTQIKKRGRPKGSKNKPRSHHQGRKLDDARRTRKMV